MKIKLGQLLLTRKKSSSNWESARIEKIGRTYFYTQTVTGGPLLKFRIGQYESFCREFKLMFI